MVDPIVELRILDGKCNRIGTVISANIPVVEDIIWFRYFNKLRVVIVSKRVFRFDLEKNRGRLVVELISREEENGIRSTDLS